MLSPLSSSPFAPFSLLPTYTTCTPRPHDGSASKLSLILRLLQHRLQLGGLHDIPLDLQLPAHKQLLRIRLAIHQLLEVLVAEHERHSGLLALRRSALAGLACLLEVEVPRLLRAGVVFEREGEDDAAFLDGVFAFRLVLQGGGDGVEGFAGGEGVLGRMLAGYGGREAGVGVACRS